MKKISTAVVKATKNFPSEVDDRPGPGQPIELVLRVG
jgi:hypothetical protein